MTSKAQVTKEKKIGILDFIKIKTFCMPKNTIKRVKKPTKWEKILVNHISGKSQVSGIYKELLKFSNKETNSLIKKKIIEDLNRDSSKEHIEPENKYMKSCFTWYIVREMHMKRKYHYIPIRMAKIQNVDFPKSGEDVKQQ